MKEKQNRWVDVLIMTALDDELQELLKVQNGAFKKWFSEKDEDGILYHCCDFNHTSGGVLKIAAACTLGQGGEATAARASALASELKPQAIAMCGICAGRQEKVNLGDLIIASQVYKYDAGKIEKFYEEQEHSKGEKVLKKEEFFQEIKTYNLPPDWLSTLNGQYLKSWCEENLLSPPLSMESQKRWLLGEMEKGRDPLESEEKENKCPNWQKARKALVEKGLIKEDRLELTNKGVEFLKQERLKSGNTEYREPEKKVEIGILGSGDKVVMDEKIFSRLRTSERDILGIEREGSGIGMVAWQKQITHFLIVKGVQDFADENKDDSFREYASRASAEFLISFLRKEAKVREKTTPTIKEKKALSLLSSPFNPKHYISYSFEEKICELIQDRAPVILWGAELVGKTWLVESILNRFRQKNPPFQIWKVDLNLLDQEVHLKTLKRFTQWMAECRVEKSGKDDISQELIQEEWRKKTGAKQTLLNFLEKCFSQTESHLLLMIDHIDVIADWEQTEELFKMLRGFIDKGGSSPWNRLHLLLSLRYRPENFQKIKEISSLNNAQIFPLTGFEETQLLELAKQYGLSLTEEEGKILLEWIGGNPYLCRVALEEFSSFSGENLEDFLSREAKFLFRDQLEKWRKKLSSQQHSNTSLKDLIIQIQKENCRWDNLPAQDFDFLESIGLIQRMENDLVILKAKLFEFIFPSQE